MITITPEHKYYDYWKPVEAGEVEPDEWQSRLMEVMQKAIDTGLFYTVDVNKWIKEHNDFIPVEWWDYQYKPGHLVEGGIMGMECYMARSSLAAKKEREEDAEALKALSVGQSLGSLCVNTKRINKCKIIAIEERIVKFSGVVGRYPCTFETHARHVSTLIDRAIKRGWRKP